MACHFPLTVILFGFRLCPSPLISPAEPACLNSDRRIKGKRAFFICIRSLTGHMSVRNTPHRLPAITPTIVSTTLATSASSNRNSFAIPSTSFRSISTACSIHFNMVSRTVAVFLKTIPTIDISPILCRNPSLYWFLPSSASCTMLSCLRILWTAILAANRIADFYFCIQLRQYQVYLPALPVVKFKAYSGTILHNPALVYSYL